MQDGTDMVKWWGQYAFAPGEARSWQVGSQLIAVRRENHEWLVARRTRPEGEHERLEVSADVPEFETAEWSRFITQRGGNTLRVGPRLADRPVVSRPTNPFHLLPGQQIELFVSSPLWMVLAAGEGQELTELPLVPLSDTWLGPSSREGELCYAARTRARLDLGAIPRRGHRATTPVRVRNRADKPLHLERLSLPLPFLSLFRVAKGDLWTEAIVLSREAQDDTATLEIEPGPPTGVRRGELLTPPRTKASKGLLVRAFGVFFS